MFQRVTWENGGSFFMKSIINYVIINKRSSIDEC